VLRGYFENRYGLQAPRRTTEEFLSDISRDALFSAEHRSLLAEFLRRCDLVKFAEHTPCPEEAATAIESCRAFIDATREDAERGREGDTEMGRRGEAGGLGRRSMPIACYSITLSLHRGCPNGLFGGSTSGECSGRLRARRAGRRIWVGAPDTRGMEVL
jgi:hypothetical protein